MGFGDDSKNAAYLEAECDGNCPPAFLIEQEEAVRAVLPCEFDRSRHANGGPHEHCLWRPIRKSRPPRPAGSTTSTGAQRLLERGHFAARSDFDFVVLPVLRELSLILYQLQLKTGRLLFGGSVCLRVGGVVTDQGADAGRVFQSGRIFCSMAASISGSVSNTQLAVAIFSMLPTCSAGLSSGL